MRKWRSDRGARSTISVVEHRVHIHAGQKLIAEYNVGVAASTPVQEYVYAGEIDSLVLIRRSDATKYGVTRNRQWSVSALHDLANGDVVERYAYEMTGKRIIAADGTTVRTTSSYGNNFGYTNRWHDEDSGLMYFRARYYNPLTGEFLSRDPMEFVDGMSLYRGYFVVNGIDSHGTFDVFFGGTEEGYPDRKPEEQPTRPKKPDGSGGEPTSPGNIARLSTLYADGSKDGNGRGDDDAWMWPVVHFDGEHPNPWSRMHGQVGRDIDVGDHLKKSRLGRELSSDDP